MSNKFPLKLYCKWLATNSQQDNPAGWRTRFAMFVIILLLIEPLVWKGIWKGQVRPAGPINCLECGKTLEIKKYLTAHMKTHLPKDDWNESQEKKKCNICHYETKRNFNLKMNMKSHKKDENKAPEESSQESHFV